MALLTLKVTDQSGAVLASASGEDFVDLVYDGEYKEGDSVVIESSEKDIHLKWQVEDSLGPAFVYLKGKESYEIPFGEKRICYSPRTFVGEKHYIFAEKARKDEIHAYRNLALNPADQHRDVNVYPHAYANVETRGESVFAAKNAIDGVRANLYHGEWPYGSWGINRQDDAALTLDFGRPVKIDRLVLYTRSDFPHDNWWRQVTFKFSDGSVETFELEKSCRPHVLPIKERIVTSLVFCDLIKADDPSPFPALTQLEVYGSDL